MATTTTAFPTNLIGGGGVMIDTLGQYPLVTRCGYNTYTQWNIFIQFAQHNNWTTFAVLYDYSDSTATANALGAIKNIQKTAIAAPAGSLLAGFKEMHFPMTPATSNYSDYLVRGSKFSRSKCTALEENTCPKRGTCLDQWGSWLIGPPL